MQIEVGAHLTNADIPTKKALKEALTSNPEQVYLYPVTAFPSPASEAVRTTADKLKEGQRVQVTGPNPYTSRKWYATVEYSARTGKLKVA